MSLARQLDQRPPERTMIEPISEMPEGAIGFRFSGEVSRADYDEVLISALDDSVTTRPGNASPWSPTSSGCATSPRSSAG